MSKALAEFFDYKLFCYYISSGARTKHYYVVNIERTDAYTPEQKIEFYQKVMTSYYKAYKVVRNVVYSEMIHIEVPHTLRPDVLSRCFAMLARENSTLYWSWFENLYFITKQKRYSEKYKKDKIIRCCKRFVEISYDQLLLEHRAQRTIPAYYAPLFPLVNNSSSSDLDPMKIVEIRELRRNLVEKMFDCSFIKNPIVQGEYKTFLLTYLDCFYRGIVFPVRFTEKDSKFLYMFKKQLIKLKIDTHSLTYYPDNSLNCVNISPSVSSLIYGKLKEEMDKVTFDNLDIRELIQELTNED